MALAAVILSVVAFIIPLGITALILAFFAKRNVARDSSLHGEGTAKAAMVIASVQLVLTLLLLLVTWGIISAAITQFRNDQMVQHLLRDYDDEKMLDHDSARDEEQIAEGVMTELMVLQEQSYRNTGRYVCSMDELVGFKRPPESVSTPELRLLYKNTERKSYVYEITRCSRNPNAMIAQYTVIAVPIPTRMPKESAIFCGDETGTMRRSSGNTSVDCILHGSRYR